LDGSQVEEAGSEVDLRLGGRIVPGREGRRVCDRNPSREIGKIAKRDRKGRER